jgi:16S rRNA (adenine1518-N6/adenine1519-N6)-dimethyltransferase
VISSSATCPGDSQANAPASVKDTFTNGIGSGEACPGEVCPGSGLDSAGSWKQARALRLAGVRPSKSRGQNFLVQPSVAARIVRAAGIEPGDAVVEIGPGLGILSGAILDAGPRKLTLVEVDARLANTLAARFSADARVELLNHDFLTVAFSELGSESLKLIGNLPFSVAAAILRRLCDNRELVARMVLMFQREVGERIRAQPGSRNYGALSAFSSLYWDIAGHFPVAAGCFHPRPKVDAEVLIMQPRAERAFDNADEADVRATVRAAFSTPRKTVRNSLAGGLGTDIHTIEAALEAAKIDPSSRPAVLDRSQLVALARILRPASSAASRA